jgi:hypothetical protein
MKRAAMIPAGSAELPNGIGGASMGGMSQPQNSCLMRINKRECFKGEVEDLAGKSVVRIARLKPDASGISRPAGPSLVFAAKHLPGMIAMLQALQQNEAVNDHPAILKAGE